MRRQIQSTGLLLAVVAILACLVFSPRHALAQSGAACPISSEAPSVQSGTSYTLSAADACKMLVFSSGSAVTITMPNAAVTVPSGFKVWIKAQGAGGVTIGTPTTSTLDGAAAKLVLTQGAGVGVRSDGTNYYSTGLGIHNP